MNVKIALILIKKNLHEIYQYDSFPLLNKVRPKINFNKRNKKQIYFVKTIMNRSRTFLCVRFDIQFNEI